MVEPRLSAVQVTGYSLGNFGKNILWNTLEFCLLFILTDIMLIKPSIAGLVIMISIIWDATLDPVVGYLADKVTTPWGKYGPFIILGSPLCCASFVLIFLTPFLLGGSNLALIIVSLLLFRTLYTLVDLPHNALIARISNSDSERSLLSGTRFFFSCMASALIAISLAPILSSSDRADEAVHFLIFAIFAAVLSLLAMWISWWSVRHIDINIARSEIPLKRTFLGITRIFKNRFFLTTLFVAFLTGLSTPVFTKMFLYYAKYDIANETMGSFGLLEYTLGSALGALCWVWTARKLDARRALQASHVVIIISTVLFFGIHPIEPVSLALTAILLGFGSAGAYMLIWALASSAVDKVEQQSGDRFEATIFAILILAMKVAIGFGSVLVGWLMHSSGYVPELVQSDQTLSNLRLMMCGAPALGSFIIFLLLFASRKAV